MPAENSIIGDCSECCVCPTPTVEIAYRQVCRVYRFFDSNTCGGVTRYFLSAINSLSPTYISCSYNIRSFLMSAGSEINWTSATDSCGIVDCDSGCESTFTGPTIYYDAANPYLVRTFSDEVSITDLQENAYSTASTDILSISFGSFTSGTASSYYDFSSSLQVTLYQSRYRFRFKIPIGFSCYRLAWVERFIPEAGVGLTSLEIITAGVYRPTVTLSAPPTGGTQARAIAVMSSTGTISSISITNPGSGYTSAPTVTVQAAINGGTSSTGWAATLTDGKVTAISGGSAGNYLPTLSFSGGGGSGAAATVTMDGTGGLASITFSSLGSAYASAPSVSISSKVSGATAATLHLHLGTETEKCTEWDGTTPSGYDPNTSSTWPTLPSASPGYFEIPVPSSEGTTTVANVRAFCDCSTCA